MEQIVSDDLVSMILDTYMYTNYIKANDGETLSAIVEKMTYDGTSQAHPNEYAILKDAVTNKSIGNLIIECQSRDMGYNSGTNAVAFINESHKKAYVVYRGTADGEWYDNGEGLCVEETKQQRQAVDYFDEVVETLNLKNYDSVITSGHSKGANKVTYVTMESKYANVITRTYAIDGQGQSEFAISKWKNRYSKKEYDDRVAKIYGINGENDFVSVLGNGLILGNHIRYVATPVIGNDIAGYHDITHMFSKKIIDENGEERLIYSAKRNDYVLKKGGFANWVEDLSKDVMKMPGNMRRANTSALMQLIEVFNGGRIAGVNGEFANSADFKIFKDTGLLLILWKVLGTKEGESLVRSLFNKSSMDENMDGATDIKVNYKALRSSADELKAMSDKLGSLIIKMDAVGMALPIYLDGSIYRKPNFDNSMVKLKGMQLGLKRISNKLEKISSLYERFDRASNSL